MRTSIIIGICVALLTFIFILALPQSAGAGPVVTKSDNQSQEDKTEGLPGLPNYAEPSEEEKQKAQEGEDGQQQAPMPAQPPQQGGYGYAQPQMPLPPTYSPGAPASNQPASSGQLPMPPTGYGTYDSPMGGGQPGMMPGPGQMGGGAMGPGPMGGGQMRQGQMMGGYQGGFMPPTPTGQSNSPLAPVAEMRMQQIYGPQSPSGVRQQTVPQRSVATHQQSTVPAGSKPFSGVTRKSPYSPYMSLFRYQDSDRGINNYYSYVKPQIEQNQQNRRVNRDVRGLQNAAQSQGLSLQQMHQRNQMKQRPGNVIPGSNVPQRMPATFMNTQQYYPGFR